MAQSDTSCRSVAIDNHISVQDQIQNSLKENHIQPVILVDTLLSRGGSIKSQSIHTLKAKVTRFVFKLRHLQKRIDAYTTFSNVFQSRIHQINSDAVKICYCSAHKFILSLEIS